MSSIKEFRRPLLASLISTLLLTLASTSGVTQKTPAKVSLRVHIEKWATDAKLSRKLTEAEFRKLRATRKKDDKNSISAYKTVTGVKAGATLEVPDIIETKTQTVAILGGELHYTKLAPNTRLKYVTIKPTEFVRTKPANLQLSVERGKGQFRVGILARSSYIKAMAPMLATAAKGTAYSVAVEGQQTTLVVAEGKVEIYRESAPGTAVTVNPREKFVYSVGSPFPTQAMPVDRADEKEIRELLSLPTQKLYGYRGGQELRRTDAEDIVTLSVRPALRILIGDEVAKWPNRPNSIYPGATGFRFVDDQGTEKRFDGEFLAASKDGKIWVVYRPGQGTLALSNLGKILTTLSTDKLRSVHVAPNGNRIIAYGQGPDASRTGAILSYRPTGGTPVKVEGTMASTLDFLVIWRRGGSRGFIVQKLNGKNVVYNLAGGASRESTQPYVDADPFEISPSGDWIMSVAGQKRYFFIPLATEQEPQTASSAFAIQSDTKPIFLSGGTGARDREKIAYTPIGTGLLFKKSPQDAGQGSPYSPTTKSPSDTYNASALSPNGELVTFLSSGTGTAYVADSADLSRDSDTYVGIIPPSTWEWVSGNEVWYEDHLDDFKDSIIITLGVRRPGVGGLSNSSTTPSSIGGSSSSGSGSANVRVVIEPRSRVRDSEGGSGSSGYVVIPPGVFQPKLVLAKDQVGKVESFQQMIKRTGAVAAINGSFFDAYSNEFVRHPVNALISNGQLIHKGNIGSVAGFDKEGRLSIVRTTLTIRGTRTDDRGRTHGWYAVWINRAPTTAETVIIYTPAWGRVTGISQGRQIVISNGQVISEGWGSQSIPSDGYVLLVTGNSHSNFTGIKVGDRMSYEIQPEDGNRSSPLFNFVEGVGAGPTLIRNGEVIADPESEGFSDPKITQQSGVRSCIGVKKDGTILLVATSGTIRQAAQKMKSLGCVEAMNLDGGASSGVYGAGKYVRPAGRPLSNALVFMRK